MLVGHLGAGLVAKSVEPKIGLGTLFAAAMLLDIALWVLVLAGVEQAAVPVDFTSRHYLVFVFPYSHSLAGAVVLSIAAAAVWVFANGRARLFAFAPAVIAATVFSHWLLDFLVHRPELTLWGPASPNVGLGLWDHQPAALVTELAIAAGGLAVFLLRVKSGWGRRSAVIGILLLTAALTFVGAFATQPPPSAAWAAGTSLAVIALAIVVGAVADRPKM